MLGLTAGSLMGVLEPLLGKLSEILGDEFMKLKDSHRDISFLRDEISTMKIALETMSEQEEADPLGSEWLSQLQELAYDAEDVIDTFQLHPNSTGTDNGFIKKILNKFTSMKRQYKLADEIKELKERSLEVSDRRKRYKVDYVASPNHVSLDPRLPALFEEAGSLVGIEDQTNDLVKWITNANGFHLQSLSIVGFGGLGKTTLANIVFKKVTSNFECTAFVAASRSPDIIMILRHILFQICGRDNLCTADQFAKTMLEDAQENRQIKDLTYRELVTAIREYLKNKRFIIVIDDIWSRHAWQQIQCVFPENMKGSRIITTTRNNDVATYCSYRKTDLVHKIPPLDDGNSKKLFFKRVFRHDEECPADLKTTADTILKKCQGLPLAIVNIGSLLANKTQSKHIWEGVLNSLGAALEQDHELEIVQRILYLSYYDLPHYLKPCFLDLSSFPEDYTIDVPRLKRRWVAEGLVTKRSGLSLEDTAENNINELINRNMVHPYIVFNGKAMSCRMHDLMLDLVLALSVKANFGTVINGCKMSPLTKTMRRLSLQGKVEDHSLWEGKDLSHVRSLTTFDGVKTIPRLLSVNRLRVLDMYHCFSVNSHYIQNIGNLTLLRYICLRGKNINKLPDEIGQLKLLRTLDVRGTGIEDLPESVGQLVHLVCLLVPPTVRLPHVIQNLVALEELYDFSALKNSSEVVGQLVSFKKLKLLRFWWSSDEAIENEQNFKEACLSSLAGLGELQELYIESMEYCSLDFLDMWCPPRCLSSFIVLGLFPFFTLLPKWIIHSELAILQIAVQKLSLEDMKSLEGLPSLVNLDIDAEEALEETHRVSGFRNLKKLYFCSTLEFGGMGLQFEAGGAKQLEDLSFTVDAKTIISAHPSFNCGFKHLACLKRFLVLINCHSANSGEVEAAEAAIRSEAALLPHHLSIQIIKRGISEMLEEENVV